MRDRVRNEQQRQLHVANAIKQDEMLNWRQRQIGQVTKEYRACLVKVGEAHLAAQEENTKTNAVEEQKLKNRKLALKRGRMAAEQLSLKRNMSNNNNNNCRGMATVDKPKKKQVTVATQVNDSVNSSNISSFSSSSSSISSSTSSVRVDDSFEQSSRTLAERLQAEYLPMASQSYKFNMDDEFDSEISSILASKKGKRVTYEVSSTASDMNGNDQRPKRKRDVTPTSILKGGKSAIDMNGNNSMDTSLPAAAPTITRVSDLLRKNQEPGAEKSAQELPKSSLHKTSLSSESLKTPPKPIIVLKKPTDKTKKPQSILKWPRAKSISPKPQPKPILKKSPMKNQKTPTKSAVKQSPKVDKRQQTPFHYVPRFVTNTQTSDPSISTVPVQRQKVQFYDHANRFGKEYEVESPLVHMHQYDASTPNARDAARTEIELEQKRLAEMVEARYAFEQRPPTRINLFLSNYNSFCIICRQIEEIRAKQALEKEKIRKDYELMTAQLEALTQQENYARIQAEVCTELNMSSCLVYGK